jgi:hypothetical protein
MEGQRHLHTTQVLADVQAAELGYALMHVGGTNNDFGWGPTMVRQVYNCRPINRQVITKIKRSHESSALLNRFEQNAIFIGVKKDYIIQSSLRPSQAGQYDNYVKWTKKAQAVGAEMCMYNGNHRWTYMDELYGQQFFNYHQAVKTTGNYKEPRQLAEAQETVDAMRKILDPGAVWLIRFFDIGERVGRLSYAYAKYYRHRRSAEGEQLVSALARTHS